jgi:LuxR family glucitol operon transcriptional activator
MSNNGQQKQLVGLHDLLVTHFDLEELRTLCFNLRVDYDSLPGEGKAGKVRELVGYCDRHDCIVQLLETGKKLRPDVPWDEVKESPLPGKGSLAPELLIRSPRFPRHEPYFPLPEREQQIEIVLDNLQRPQQRPVVMISGLGGVGKTALAVEVARRCAQPGNQPFQAIVWESAKQEMFVDGEITRIGDAVIDFSDLVDSLGRQIYGPDFSHQPDRDKSHSLTAALQTKPCLVMVDNLETMLNAQDIVMQLQGMLGEHSRALITSRKVENTSIFFHIPLSGLGEASSIAFLREEGRQRNIQVVVQADQDPLKKIYQITQGIPLAMKLIVGLVAELGLRAVLKKFEQGVGEIYDFLFLQTFQQLSEPAQRLLRYMGTAETLVDQEELEIAFEGTDLDSAAQELVHWSLLNIQISPDLEKQEHEIHQLTRYYVVNKFRATH